MNYRNLGKWGVKVSEVALGSWLTYGGATETAAAERCIHRAYELGINFFDTANAYAAGEAEKVVGKTLASYNRSSLFVATKVFFPVGEGPNDRGLSRKHIFEQCHASLKRLNMDYVDLYQCHRYDTSTPLEETLYALDDLVSQGKALYYGVSEWSADQITQAVIMADEYGLHKPVSNQPEYNMISRRIETEVIPRSEELGLGQVVWSPLAQGLLTGKYKPGAPIPAGSRASDTRQNYFMNQGNLDQAELESIAKLGPIAWEAGLTMSQLALAWCLRQPNVSSVITGATRPEQVEENAGASGKTIAPELLARIDQALAGIYNYDAR